jgi:hypothetical protein
MPVTVWTCCLCGADRKSAPALEHQHLGCCARFSRACRSCVVGVAVDAGIVDRQGEHRRQAARSALVKAHEARGCR